MPERKKKLSRIRRMERARETVVILKIAKTHSWKQVITCEEPIMLKFRKRAEKRQRPRKPVLRHEHAGRM